MTPIGYNNNETAGPLCIPANYPASSWNV